MSESRIDRIVAELIGGPIDGTDPAPGASLLVMRGNDVLFSRSYGYADVEGAVRSNPATNYRLASVTKQFTAASVLLLIERDALALDERITAQFPELPDACEAVTVRHLLTHTSGIVDYEDLIPEHATIQVRDRDVLRLVSAFPQLYFAPGTAYRYSNSGYALLALLVEKVSGKRFARFLGDEIFRRAGMESSVAFEESGSSIRNRAYGYSRFEDQWVRTDQNITSAVLGDGGIYSSTEDLARWSRAFHGGIVLGSDMTRLATSPLVATDEEGVMYGFGWRISEDRGRRVVWHSGETIGFRNVSLYVPADDLTVIVLSNQNQNEPYAAALEIAESIR